MILPAEEYVILTQCIFFLTMNIEICIYIMGISFTLSRDQNHHPFRVELFFSDVGKILNKI